MKLDLTDLHNMYDQYGGFSMPMYYSFFCNPQLSKHHQITT